MPHSQPPTAVPLQLVAGPHSRSKCPTASPPQPVSPQPNAGPHSLQSAQQPVTHSRSPLQRIAGPHSRSKCSTASPSQRVTGPHSPSKGPTLNTQEILHTQGKKHKHVQCKIRYDQTAYLIFSILIQVSEVPSSAGSHTCKQRIVSCPHADSRSVMLNQKMNSSSSRVLVRPFAESL